MAPLPMDTLSRIEAIIASHRAPNDWQARCAAALASIQKEKGQ